eukprot:CAMPEP_0198666044 /NCGR_PEP_ID=MMETSP1467-20131203/63125_1 /TAXON_ID=1462469 /ORGANISM="unid. sp., Strain CCMP2135" /LENGTH=47 /DNA_ID= /DNA_START= /DNA_END= /DNA_ORIENTATION=
MMIWPDLQLEGYELGEQRQEFDERLVPREAAGESQVSEAVAEKVSEA